MKVAFELFWGLTAAELVAQTAEEAASFAGSLRPDQLITITQTLDGQTHRHLITVWYWDESEDGGAAADN
jgi:hypothetical protein